MKFLFYYSRDRDFGPFEKEKAPEFAEGILTPRLVGIIIRHHAKGEAPYMLSVPREEIVNCHSDDWKHLSRVIRIAADVGYDDSDTRPCGMATLQFQGVCCFIWYRRIMPWDIGIMEPCKSA